MVWTPRSQRLGQRNLDGPYDGVPTHLRGPLIDWLEQSLLNGGEWETGLMTTLTVRLRVPITPGSNGWDVMQAIKKACQEDENTFLDFVEGVLYAKGLWSAEAPHLKELLALAGSSLTVSSDQPVLVDVVNPQSQAIYDSAVSGNDEITVQLQEAYGNAYGRSPDPSDAWDHAIKAVEAILRPVVQPNNAKATLGNVIGELGGQNGGQWEVVFPGKDLDNNVVPFVETLKLMWPNTDRHGGGNGRPPTLDEARAVVGLTATIVQAHRQGWVVRRR